MAMATMSQVAPSPSISTPAEGITSRGWPSGTTRAREDPTASPADASDNQHLPNTPANQDAATSNTTTTSSSLTKDNNKAKQMPEEASSSSNGSASSTAKAMDGLGITGSNTAPPSPSPRQKPSTPSPSLSHSSPSLSTRRGDARADGMRQGDSSASAAAEPSSSERKAVSMKRTSSGAYRSPPVESNGDEDTEADKTVVAGPSHQRSDTAQSSERAAVLSDAAVAAAASKRRRHRRRASRDSGSSGRDDESEEHDSPRSRTPSPILGRGFFLQSTPGRAGAPVSGPSAADIQSLLRGSERGGAENMYSSVEAAKPSSFQDVAEVQSLVDKVGKMQTSARGDQIQELVESVQKLGQHAIAQDAYISSMEASMNNTRVTAVSVISNLTAAHAYEMNQERHLRDRLEVELEGAHASARKLSSLLARSKNRNEEFDRQRAASVEEEMKWAASLPGSGPRKPSAAAVAGANAAISPSMPQTGDREARAEPPATPSKANDGPAAVGLGLGLTNTPGGGSSGLNAEYTDVFDSPMSALVQERNKLVADKRYLRNRVRDAEAQLGRLENELKALRPLLVHGGARALAAGSTPSAPVTPASQRHYDAHAGMNTGGSGSATTPGRGRRDRSRRRRPTTLGDAEAEHLLLAARRLNNARAQQAQSGSVPPMLPDHASPSKPSTARFADPTERPRTPPSRLPAQSNTPQHFPPPKTPTSQLAALSKTPRSVGLSSASGKARALVSGVVPEQPSSSSLSSSSAAAAAAMGSPKPRPKPVLGHERMGSNGGAGMDELLHAAQSVLTPRDRAAAAQAQASAPNNYFPPAASAPMTGMPVTSHHDHRPSFYESPKRRRVSVADYNSPSGQQANRVLSASPQQRYISALHHKSSQNVLGGSRRTRTVTEGADAAGIASPVSYQRGATHGTGSASGDRSGSGGEGRRSDGDDAGSTGFSALDLLADQAAASQNPSQSSEPSDSDHERHRNGFSSQEEGPDHDGGHHRRGSRVSAAGGGGGTRSAASSLIAARARASAAAPIAYSQSVAPHMDYPSTPPLPPTPTRFQYSGNGSGGLPPPPPPPPFGAPLASLPGMSPSHRNSGAGGMGADNNSVLGSPISSGHHHHHHRYSSSGGGSGPLFDPYGHRGSAGSYLGGLPPINTSLPPPPPPPPHGMHSMGPSHAHYPAPPPPPLSAPPHHHHGGHSHHRSLSGLNGSVGGVNGSGQMAGAGAGAAPGFMGSASPSASPVSATKSSKHQRSSASIDMGGTPAQTPRSSAKHGGSSSATANASMANHSSSNSAAAAAAAAAAKQKGGNTSPDKRLPYVRWTAEEDSKLRRAIGQHGQRWEAVAKAVGTRSYHQCRQRALLMRRKGVDPAGGGSGGGGGTDGGGGSSSAGERGLADGDDDGGDEGDGYD